MVTTMATISYEKMSIWNVTNCLGPDYLFRVLADEYRAFTAQAYEVEKMAGAFFVFGGLGNMSLREPLILG